MRDIKRYRAATDAMIRVHAQDPRRETDVDGEHPVELLYTQRLVAWIERLEAEPSEELLLAAHGLHLSRWTIPRDSYPMTRKAYHDWRDRLRALHADETEAVLRECLYDDATVDRVRALVLRTTYPDDPESRIIEDAVSLLLLDRQFVAFAAKTERAKTLRVVRRVWARMTPQAQEIALTLPLDEDGAELVREALTPPE
ncbi:DUF4202 domain-containing protein [Candidatus Poribacteria bacterium]|jgi:hypothetical protein|nr:DUF4202 domain-containing protein [Candidatus Poribacteria bacterium]MBT5533163.1 DUF4202 domain-containing protein [Candidatus Poribacteria bacterium]MBT5711001.1 DUF4202 domain-containing protein [Candidatus Poribacteria bacterium]MBT7097410.1 DUF4202 domain-containing protein [Candidatus Poribacteria bacterium]MBT7803948.1 DUF4202 domain-containing protein [Candidatus Poribacteria bacterium]